MEQHIEKVCAGLKALEDRSKQRPDYLLYTGDSADRPDEISGIPVIESVAYLGGLDFGTAGDIKYLPCYNKIKEGNLFTIYKNAYEDNTRLH